MSSTIHFPTTYFDLILRDARHNARHEVAELDTRKCTSNQLCLLLHSAPDVLLCSHNLHVATTVYG